MTPREREDAILAGCDYSVQKNLEGQIEDAIIEAVRESRTISDIPKVAVTFDSDQSRECARLLQEKLDAVERERDEARAELKTMTCMWNGLRDKLTEVRADLAQRDRRIAELEAALRPYAGQNVAAIDAALSATAQPATATNTGICTECAVQVMGGKPCQWHAAPPSPAARCEHGRMLCFDCTTPWSATKAGIENDGYFTCPTCKGIGSHEDECQWVAEHYPSAVISSNRENCPECKQPVYREGTKHMLPCSRAPQEIEPRLIVAMDGVIEAARAAYRVGGMHTPEWAQLREALAALDAAREGR